MITISQSVEELLNHSPFLAEVIGEGLANNAEISRKIKPQIEARLLEKVSETAIAMAIHRLSKKLKRPAYGKTFLKQMHDITVRSNLVEFIFTNSNDLPKIWQAILQKVEKKEDTFLNFSRGLQETIVVVNAELKKEVQVLLKKEKNLQIHTGLSAITLKLPKQSLRVPGVYYPILKALAWEGISFEEVMSVGTELSILFNDKDIDKAFSILKRLTA
jgi:aspartokinase